MPAILPGLLPPCPVLPEGQLVLALGDKSRIQLGSAAQAVPVVLWCVMLYLHILYHHTRHMQSTAQGFITRRGDPWLKKSQQVSQLSRKDNFLPLIRLNFLAQSVAFLSDTCKQAGVPLLLHAHSSTVTLSATHSCGLHGVLFCLPCSQHHRRCHFLLHLTSQPK